MARHGENIRKREDGRWEARYQMSDAAKGRKIYRSVYGSTYEEAKQKRADAVRMAREMGQSATETASKKDTPYIQLLFSQAAKEWLEEISVKHKYSTYIKYENIYRSHLEEISGSFTIFDMQGGEFQEKISDHLSKAGLSDSIRRSVCCVVNRILTYAGRKYSVHVPLLRLTAVKPVRKPIETFTKAEQSRILEYIYSTSNKYRTALLLCLYTGMRLGELCALKWTDFDFQDKIVAVGRTVQRIVVKGYATKTILMETDPKSESSKRIIPLTDETILFLEELKGSQPYVFGGDKPLEPRTMQYQLKQILKEVNVEDRNFHVLRHTFATNCVESGMDVKTLSVILGHSDVKITLNRYVHPTMDSKRTQIGRLPEFYGQIRGQLA